MGNIIGMKTINTNDRLTAPLETFERQGTVPKTSVEAVLAAHPFLAGMSAHQRGLLTDCAMLSHFKPGEFLICEGDPANRFYLLIKGKIALESYVEEEGRRLVQTIGAGDVLGWSWLFPPYYWHFDAQATEPTDVVFFYATPLREECEADHDFGYEMLKRMSEIIIHRLQATRKELLHLKSPV
jgi:CRP-like cAMP-binding protein